MVAVAAVVAATTIVTAQTAFAATTTVVVSPDNLRGWSVDPPAPPFAFVAGPSTTGIGSLQFETIDNVPANTEKMFVKHTENVNTTNLDGISFDYYIHPSATNKNANQWYLNVYVDSSFDGTPPANFYECRYDYVAAAGGDGWHTLSINKNTVATAVAVREGAPCGTSIAAGSANSTIFLIGLNAGDTSASDTGVRGGFDTVKVSSSGNTTLYDFEPSSITCPGTGPGTVGTAGADTINGTAGADRIDALAGADRVNALGGADCVLGGAGPDFVDGGTGDDKLSGGPDNDIVDGGDGADMILPGTGPDTVRAGAGSDQVLAGDGERDYVDCGAGTDQAVVDAIDSTINCETVTPAT